MLLRYFYNEKLAHASYLVGCQQTGEAIVIDPARDVTPYQRVAQAEGLQIVAATETHIHADFVSGARELAEQWQAKLYLSAEGGKDWQYRYVGQLGHRQCGGSDNYELVRDGDRFTVGNVAFDVMHTPGHTPESMSLLLTDCGGQAERPMGIFTGDFVFVGDVGRPDLLEKVGGAAGSAVSGARAMFRSLQTFKQLPDYVQVWPAHGAGSACGKALGAVPSSTVGYEKLYNWALAHTDETAFVTALLSGQPEAPTYFAAMKQVNKDGPPLLKELPQPERIQTGERLRELLPSRARIVDTRPCDAFAKRHVAGTINIPYNRSFTNWAGWLIDDTRPLYFLVAAEAVPDMLRDLRAIGIDRVAGYMHLDDAFTQCADLFNESYREAEPAEMCEPIAVGDVTLIDVRNRDEWQEGHIAGAHHMMLGTLPEGLDEVDELIERTSGKPLLLQCRSGARSAIAASILQAYGVKEVVNLQGGIDDWQAKGLPVVRPSVQKFPCERK
ncbi:MBL fold metallo-hydrolase [Numidum massiliense]|uniref:MBL fold metallo-hydrolase n=1 Tax=Numidum massiliense TaxID=1522315 RepID=UPI0006D54AEA|nr:MBL fold metallo-hydrolase [Numidum massiliense]